MPCLITCPYTHDYEANSHCRCPFQVTGTPSLEHRASISPSHKLAVKQLCTLAIPVAAHAQTISDIQLLPLGLGLAVLTRPTVRTDAPDAVVLFRQDGTGLSWRIVGSYETPRFAPPPAVSHATPSTSSMTVLEDGSKIVFLSGGAVHVLDAQQETLVPILSTPPSPPLHPEGDEPASDAVLTQSISPNCCCLCRVSESPVAPREAGGGVASSRLHLCVLTLPDVPDTLKSTLFLGARSAHDGLRPLEMPQKMDALRLAWAARQGTHPWDIVQRCLSPSASGGGHLMHHMRRSQRHSPLSSSYSSAIHPPRSVGPPDETAVAAILDAFDQLMLSFDSYALPSYVPAMDRVKLALLRETPGKSAALVASDLATRLLLKQMLSVTLVRDVCDCDGAWGSRTRAWGSRTRACLDRRLSNPPHPPHFTVIPLCSS
jgi:hypothetical protein